MEKIEVLKAEHRLAEELMRRGCAVKVVRLPQEGPDKVGLDDFLVAYGPEALKKLMEEAIEAEDEPEVTYARGLIKKGVKPKQVIEALAKIPSVVERERLITLYSKAIKVPKIAIRADVQSLLQTTSPEEKGEQQYKALFPGLVDVVEVDGLPAFLVKKEGQLKIVSRYYEEEQAYSPPPKDKIPWLLPRATEVLKYYKGDNDRQLYESAQNSVEF